MASILERFYRIVCCRGGYGVHSPFAYNLITTVIEEKRDFYCYETLDNIRLQLQQENRKLRCGEKELTLQKAMQTYCFSVNDYRLLFRLANRFHPGKAYIIGSGLGLTPLYVSAYSQKAECVVIEREQSIADMAGNVVEKYARSSIKIYNETFDAFKLPEQDCADLIVWGKGTDFSFRFFEKMLPYVTTESIMIIHGISCSFADKQTWNRVCAHPKVSATFDLYSLGIVFFNSKLHQKTYKTILV